MPNWTYNRVYGSKKVCDALLGKDRNPTFQKLIPVPEGIEIASALSDYEKGLNYSAELIAAFIKYYFDDDDAGFKNYLASIKYPKDYDEAIKDLHKVIPMDNLSILRDTLEQYHTLYWYDWRNQYWGCKWDANPLMQDPYEEDVTEIEFETPWSPPEGVIQEIAKQFPDEEWTWHADEESCAFSIDYTPDGSGGYWENDVDPEYYMPYFPDNPEDFKQDFENLTTKQDILEQINITLPNLIYRDIKLDEKTKTITVTVYNYPSYGGEKLYDVTFENVNFNYSDKEEK